MYKSDVYIIPWFIQCSLALCLKKCIYFNFKVLYWLKKMLIIIWAFSKLSSFCNSNFKNHWSNNEYNNDFKNPEILQELPKFDTETWNEKMLQEKNSSQDCHNLQFAKNLVSEKHNKAKCNRMRYACISQHPLQLEEAWASVSVNGTRMKLMTCSLWERCAFLRFSSLPVG